MNIRLLLIEDDMVDELALVKAVRDQQLPYTLTVARSVAQARVALAAQRFDIILSDYHLGDGTSFDLMDAFTGQLVIFVTGAGDEDVAVRALHMGVHDYLVKDVNRGYLTLLSWRVTTALRQWNSTRQLMETEAKFRAVIDASPVPMALNDEALRITYLNPAFVQTFGYTLADIPEVAHWWVRAYPEPVYRQWVQDTWVAKLDEARLTGADFSPMEVRVRCKDGSNRFALVSASPLEATYSQTHLVLLYDITERRKGEQVTRERDQRFRDLVEATDGIVWEADVQTFDFLSVSQNAERMLGYPAKDWLLPGFWAEHIYAPDREWAVAHCAACTARLANYDFEYRFVAYDGRVVWLRDSVRVGAVDGQPRWLRGLMVDITSLKLAEENLCSALQEKTALLNEVHHRVKNNLQVITSLLRLEVGRSSDPAVCSVLDDMKGRIRSMALLHESLYRTGTFASVDLGAYLKQLCMQAFRSNDSNDGSVRLELDLAPLAISLDQATPAGLLVNELISNCLKHAFVDGRSGVVQVSLQQQSDRKWCLRVADTGVGLADDFDVRRAQSLGLQLVSDLATQMDGVLHIEPHSTASGGAVFSVVFLSKK
jgi:PAS domain S-box-containing protein